MRSKPSTETKVAFLKGVKFWLVFLLAVLFAALLWKVFGGDGSSAA